MNKVNSCYMIEKGPPAFCVLGRYGDIIQLLPAFKAVHDRIGMKPIVVSSTDYTSVYDGVSYVSVFPINGSWYGQVPFARDLARQHFGSCIVPQWWHETDRHEEICREQAQDHITVLQSHGFNWGVDMNKNPDYGTSMWWRCGFSREEMLNLPLIFDRRKLDREEALAAPYLRSKKPLLLYNFVGNSSPFAPVPEIMQIVAPFGDRFKFVDLGRIMAHRIYDLLGLYDRAAGLITTDTATLHLAPASKVPYFAYKVNGWSASVPKGNCKGQCFYTEALDQDKKTMLLNFLSSI